MKRIILLLLVIGPVMVRRTPAGIRVMWNRNVNLSGGMAACLPLEPGRMTPRRAAVMILGGPVASVVLVVGALWLAAAIAVAAGPVPSGPGESGSGVAGSDAATAAECSEPHRLAPNASAGSAPGPNARCFAPAAIPNSGAVSMKRAGTENGGA